jgi:hypothetical protein
VSNVLAFEGAALVDGTGAPPLFDADVVLEASGS